MQQIPVYGLNGIEAAALGAPDLGKVCGLYTPKSTGRSFNRYASKLKNTRYKKAVLNGHANDIANLSGIYNVSYSRITDGSANAADFVNLKKVKILIALNDMDYNAFRFAKIIMPYVIDIDNEGGFYFNNAELAQAAAQAEQDFFNYVESPAATEVGIDNELARLDGWFKKFTKTLGNGFKAVGKAVVNSVTLPIKSTIKGAKAGFQVTKAGIQAISGDKEGAKKSLKKAWDNAKDSVVEPVVTTFKDGVNVFKTTVINPTTFGVKTARDVFRSSVKVAGKVFKVLFLKINPVTASLRAQLRAVIAINFMGMASRFNVGLMTQEQAAAQGYDLQAWQTAKKAVERIIKLFEKMGGKKEKILKSIVKGASRKPLFKKDIENQMRVNVASENETEESSLGFEPMTILAIVTAIIKVITYIWQWISQVVKQRKANKAALTAQQQQEQQAKEQQQRLQEMYNKYAHNDQGEFFTDENGNLITWEEYDQIMAEGETDDDKKKKALLIASGVAVVGIAALMLTK